MRQAQLPLMMASGMIGVAVGVAGLFRDRLIAQYFGIGHESDIFFLTLAFPLFVASLFTSLTVSGFMPTYLHDHDKTLMARMMTIHIAAGILVGALALSVVPFLAENFRHTGMLFLLIIPLTAVSSLLAAALQSRRQYLFVNSLPMLPHLAAIAAILFFSSHGIVSAAWGIVCGYGLVLLAVAVRVRLIEGPFILSFPAFDKKLKVVVGQYAALITGIAAMAANFMIDQVMAAQYGVGQASTLVYGSRVTGLVVMLAAAAMSNILLTEFSHMESRNDSAGLKKMSCFYERLVLAGAGLAIVPVVLFSAGIIDLLFGSGQMAGGQLHDIALVQDIYILQLPFYIGGMIYVHRLSAMKRNDVITRIALANFLLNILLNLVLGHFWGVFGIAAATSLVYLHSWVRLKLYFRNND